MGCAARLGALTPESELNTRVGEYAGGISYRESWGFPNERRASDRGRRSSGVRRYQARGQLRITASWRIVDPGIADGG